MANRPEDSYKLDFPDIPPPGCSRGWPVRLVAQSGIHIVYGAPHSRQPPGVTRMRGIGIKIQDSVPHRQAWRNNRAKFGLNATQDKDDWRKYTTKDDHDSSWAGLYDQKLHELYYPFVTSDVLSNTPDTNARTMLLHLPMMGMAPREPTKNMMDEAKSERFWSLTEWFRYAYVIKATDLRKVEAPHDLAEIVIGTKGSNPGEDIVIKLPKWPKNIASESAGSLYSNTEDVYGMEFRTALPECEVFNQDYSAEHVNINNLYFVQLLQNELPSYHFWHVPDSPDPQWRHRPEQRMHPEAIKTRVRMFPDARGSPHYTSDPGLSNYALLVQRQNLRANTSPRRPNDRRNSRAGNSPPTPTLPSAPRTPPNPSAAGASPRNRKVQRVPRKRQYDKKSDINFNRNDKAKSGPGLLLARKRQLTAAATTATLAQKAHLRRTRRA